MKFFTDVLTILHIFTVFKLFSQIIENWVYVLNLLQIFLRWI